MGSYLVSMVVDGLPEHYYKAELLLFTLGHFGKVPATDVIVQCVDRVDPAFASFVQNRGHRLRTIPPYLDGAYCNKLQQLEGIESELSGKEGVVLLDIDMVVLGSLELPSTDAVCGKIADGPNPPIAVLERVFDAAGAKRPDRVSTDRGADQTLATNLNGGLIYVPSRLAAEVSTRWRDWGKWLFERPDLFDEARQRKHIDQVAMALALASGSVRLAPIAANFNFPTHVDRMPHTFNPEKPLQVLHYHSDLDVFGLIRPALNRCSALDEAVERVNEAIAAQREFVFFDPYKRDISSRACSGATRAHDRLKALLQEAGFMNGKRRRLILHAGTPKTGTSSLQCSLDDNRDLLRRHGILYPRTDGTTRMPKHQWLVNCLHSDDEDEFCRRIRTALEEADAETHTVFLSTQGIFNHWWDFAPSAKSMLATLTAAFDAEIWVWFRDPESFANSSYRQNISNPRVYGIPVYGRDLSFEEMLDDSWFARHLDYLGFVREAQCLFGDSAVKPIRYTGDTVGAAVKLLGITDWPDDETRENTGLGKAGVYLARLVNRCALNAALKRRAMWLIRGLDKALGKDRAPFELSESGRRRVLQLSALGAAVLDAEFGLNWR